MNLRTTILSISTLLIFSSVAIAQKERERISLHGNICKSTMGVPKWSADNSVNNYGELGDLIILSVQSNPKEKIVVGAYLYYRTVSKSGEEFVDTSDWKPVPVSQIGKQWGYRSNSLQSVGNWTRFTNASNNISNSDVQLFLPYAANGLPAGTYRFRYRIRVWANNTVVDDFYTNENRLARVAGTDTYRELLAICAAADGPSICEFTLLGAK